MKFFKLLFILLVFGCQSSSKELPILSYKFDDLGNKYLYTITYQNFTNHLGETFTTKTIDNKIVITNFFFTRCPSICPPMRSELIAIAESFKDENDFMIVSHTIDPNNDTTEALMNYSEATGIPSHRWQFVRSSIENTKAQANVFMTNFRPNEDETDFYHSSYVALLDKAQQIRGFYNTLVKADMDRLKNDIRRLLE